MLQGMMDTRLRRALLVAIAWWYVLPCGGVRAQTLPSLENEWLHIDGLGPIVQGDAFRWNLDYRTKMKGLTRIEVQDPLEKGARPLLVVEGSTIYAKATASGEPLSPQRFQWIYEEPATFRLLTVLVSHGKQTKSLHVPLAFSEGTKSTLRFLVQERMGYTQALVPGVPYQLFDGRKWILQKSERTAGGTRMEYALEDAGSPSLERVVQTVFLHDASIAQLAGERRAALQAHCATGRWNEESVSAGSQFYEWSTADCPSLEYEAGSFRKLERGILLTSYSYGPGAIPEGTRLVWRQLLAGHP